MHVFSRRQAFVYLFFSLNLINFAFNYPHWTFFVLWLANARQFYGIKLFRHFKDVQFCLHVSFWGKKKMTSLKDKLSDTTNKFIAVTWWCYCYLGHLKNQINLLWCFSFIFKSISPPILPEIPSNLESHNYITFEMRD